MAKRVRKFCLVTYLTEQDMVSCFTKHQKSIRGYEYILHDKDVMEDGTLKEPHFHVNLLTYDSRVPADICAWFVGVDSKGQSANTRCEPCTSLSSSHRYLTHKDNPEKFQYTDDLIVFSDPSLFETDSYTEDTSFLALNDMLSGVPLQVIARRYGRDFLYHYGHIKAVYNDIQCGLKYDPLVSLADKLDRIIEFNSKS